MKKMITYGKMSWSWNIFSRLILQRNVWRAVLRISRQSSFLASCFWELIAPKAHQSLWGEHCRSTPRLGKPQLRPHSVATGCEPRGRWEGRRQRRERRERRRDATNYICANCGGDCHSRVEYCSHRGRCRVHLDQSKNPYFPETDGCLLVLGLKGLRCSGAATRPDSKQ